MDDVKTASGNPSRPLRSHDQVQIIGDPSDANQPEVKKQKADQVSTGHADLSMGKYSEPRHITTRSQFKHPTLAEEVSAERVDVTKQLFPSTIGNQPSISPADVEGIDDQAEVSSISTVDRLQTKSKLQFLQEREVEIAFGFSLTLFIIGLQYSNIFYAIGGAIILITAVAHHAD